MHVVEYKFIYFLPAPCSVGVILISVAPVSLTEVDERSSFKLTVALMQKSYSKIFKNLKKQ